MDKSISWQFLPLLRPHTSTGVNIKDALLQNIMIMAIYCVFFFFFFFTSIEAKYTHLDTSIPGVRFTKVFRTELGHKYILVECFVIALCLPVVSKLSHYKLVCYK